MTKKTFIISGMHCTSCSLLIEGELEDLGVKAEASYAKGEVKAEWAEDKVSESQIKEAITKLGYVVN